MIGCWIREINGRGIRYGGLELEGSTTGKVDFVLGRTIGECIYIQGRTSPAEHGST